MRKLKLWIKRNKAFSIWLGIIIGYTAVMLLIIILLFKPSDLKRLSDSIGGQEETTVEESVEDSIEENVEESTEESTEDESGESSEEKAGESSRESVE